MGVRQAVAVAILVLAGATGFAAEPPGRDEYAKVEVRAKLRECASPLEKPGVRWYEVTVGLPGAAGRLDLPTQTFRLDLPTKELAELAKALDGAVVVVAGDLTVEPTGQGVGDLGTFFPNQRAVIRVTSLSGQTRPRSDASPPPNHVGAPDRGGRG